MEDLKARGNVYLLLSIITAVGVWNIANGTQVKASSKRSVYRLYNSNVKGGDHYYTLSKYEAKTLVNLGWRWDNNANPVFYSTGTVNLYVSYNPNAQSGAHNYTTNIFEQNSLLSVGWKYGAIAWKTMPSDSLPGTPAGWKIDKPMNIDNYSLLLINNVLGGSIIKRKSLELTMANIWEMVRIGKIKQVIRSHNSTTL